MYKKVWCTCKVVVLLIKPTVFFLTFSPSSASLDLKVPIIRSGRDVRQCNWFVFVDLKLSVTRKEELALFGVSIM